MDNIPYGKNGGTAFPLISLRVNRAAVLNGKGILSHLAFVHVNIHSFIKLSLVLNPLIVNSIGQATENIIGVLKSLRQDIVNFFILGFAVNQIKHINKLSSLAEALDMP